MRLVLRILLPLLVLAIAGAIAYRFVATRPEAKRGGIPHLPPLVTVHPLETQSERVEVTGMGTVTPARQVKLTPEVGGRIVEMHPNLLPGGRVQEGDELIRIEPRDYELAIELRKADVARATLEFKLEQGRAAVAAREWDVVAPVDVSSELGRDLALRKPQLEATRVGLASSRAAVEQAELNLERTSLAAPFDAVVIEDYVEVGLQVSPQTPIATLVGSNEFWVEALVPVERLAWIDIPGVNAEEGSPATVVHQSSDGFRVERPAKVVRLLSSLEQAGRLARVVVAVEDPLDAGPSNLPLLLGAYVEVRIEGHELGDSFLVPRTALRDGNIIWTIDAENRLHVRTVEIAWRTKDTVMVRGEIDTSERLVTSRVGAAVEGMKLRVEGEPYVPEPWGLLKYFPAEVSQGLLKNLEAQKEGLSGGNAARDGDGEPAAAAADATSSEADATQPGAIGESDEPEGDPAPAANDDDDGAGTDGESDDGAAESGDEEQG